MIYVDYTKRPFMSKGISITEGEVVFDYAVNRNQIKRVSIICIVIGSLTIIAAGLGLVSVGIGIWLLLLSPEKILNQHQRYLRILSQQTGKPIVYKNLPAEIEHMV